MASPSPSWVILGRAATVRPSGDGIPQGAALALALAAPPRVTAVTLHPSVSPVVPDRGARFKAPFVVASDPSGPILLLTPPRTWRDEHGVERTIRVSQAPIPGYFVCDVSSAAPAASSVPDPDRLIFNNDLGVMAAPGSGGHFMVAEFQHIVGGRDATLLCFSSRTCDWVEKTVANPLPRWIWTFSDVVSHGGKLWWVDNVAGLLACDPFASQPDVLYVRLPDGDVQHRGGCGYCSQRALGSRRVVQLSEGKFRCVEMSHASNGATKVSMHTLSHPETGVWTLDYEASFPEIWASESYKAAGLPEKAPVLALVHPKNSDVVYFFLDEHLFGVDLRARKVVECEPYQPDDKKWHFSSRLLLPFELPPAFSAGSSEVGTENRVNEELSTSASSAPSASDNV